MIAALHTKLGLKRSELKKDEGFTLIELLVVILIIGVLAAIAIPVFLGQQQQAADAAAKANLANAKIAYQAYLVNNSAGTATPASSTEVDALEELGFPSDGSTTVVTGGTAYCITSGGWQLTSTSPSATAGNCTT